MSSNQNATSTSLRQKFLAYQSTPRYRNEITRIHIDSINWHNGLAGPVAWLEICIDDFDNCDRKLFQKFLDKLIVALTNIGIEAVDFTKHFDRILNLYRKQHLPLTELYIAKASYLATYDTESDAQQHALESAIQAASTPLETLLAYRANARYFINISRYRLADDSLEKCEQILIKYPNLYGYRCSIYTLQGIIEFTSFRNHKKAEELFRQAVALRDEFPGSDEVPRNVSTALHYLGRLAEVKKNLPAALHFYVESQQYLEISTNEATPTAFYHLRIGELLTSAKLFDDASYHLSYSQMIFDKVQNNASGLIQVELALAALHIAQGEISDAKAAISKSLEIAVSKGYTRGQLLCLGYQLTLHVRKRELLQIPYDIKELIRISFAATGEVRRNNLISMISNLPIMVNFLLRRINGMKRGEAKSTSTNDQTLNKCTCPFHAIESTLNDNGLP